MLLPMVAELAKRRPQGEDEIRAMLGQLCSKLLARKIGESAFRADFATSDRLIIV